MRAMIIIAVVAVAVGLGLIMQARLVDRAERMEEIGNDDLIRQYYEVDRERQMEASSIDAKCEVRDGAIHLLVYNSTDYDFANLRIGVYFEADGYSGMELFSVGKLDSWDTTETSLPNPRAISASVASIRGDRQ